METEKLVRMANQIAANLNFGKDQEKPIAETHLHFKRFWTPQMRQQIVEHYRQAGEDTGLVRVAAEAVARLAEEQVPA